MAQGFARVEHPWDPRHRPQARAALARKVRGGDSRTGVAERLRQGTETDQDLRMGGRLARVGLLDWLDRRPAAGPWFAFLNYMEAHHPLLPPDSLRARVMSASEVAASRTQDQSWSRRWSHVFGLQPLAPSQIALIAKTYDAACAELDQLLEQLIGDLQGRGDLDNTVVVLTSDHGEHLGEHGLLDHRYSLYEPLLRVPLVLRLPRDPEPGRSADPVMVHDLFPTLLELAGVASPPLGKGGGRPLLATNPARARMALYMNDFRVPRCVMESAPPGMDPTPWTRRLWALYDGRWKLLSSEIAPPRLFDLAADPAEEHDLAATRPERAAEMLDALEAVTGGSVPRGFRGTTPRR